MPPRTRTPDGGPEGVPSPEELEHLSDELAEEHTEVDEAQPDIPLIYDGEVLTSGMTLAVVLPGDQKESYFPTKFTARKQPDETEADLAARVVTVVRETCLSQIDDAIDAIAEYQKQLSQSGRLQQ